MSLDATLNAVRQSVKEIPNINRGGCGAFALAVIKQLKNKGLKCRLRVANNWVTLAFFHSEPDGLEKVAKNASQFKTVQQLNQNNCFVGHVFIEVFYKKEWRALDSDSFLPIKTYLISKGLTEYKGEMPEPLLEELVRHPEGWNESFDREYIPLLFDKVNAAFPA